MRSWENKKYKNTWILLLLYSTPDTNLEKRNLDVLNGEIGIMTVLLF